MLSFPRLRAASARLALAIAGLVGATGAGAAPPDYNFVLYCAGCHGFDASGSPKDRVPSLRGAMGHFLKVPDGRAFLIQVPGNLQAPITDAEVAELANWMLRTFSATEMPEGAAPYSAREVASLRARPPTDILGQRASIIKRLQGMGIRID